MSSQQKYSSVNQSQEREATSKRTNSSLAGTYNQALNTFDYSKNQTPDIQRMSMEKGSSQQHSHQSQKSNKSKMNLKINTQGSIFRNSKKFNNKNKPAMSNYILLNTRAQLSKEKKEELKSHREMLFEYSPKGKLKRVKFESPQLRYDLKELFDNIPELKTCFDEPIPNFAEMNQEEREKIIIKIHENLDPNKRKVTQREIDQQNNLAFRNLEREGLKTEDHYAQSQWKTISKVALNPYVQNKILPEYKKQKNYKEFKDIKQHNRPFSLYLKEDLDGLIKLTERYKEMYPPESNRSKSKTLSNEDPPQSALPGHYIDFSVFKSQKPGNRSKQNQLRIGKKESSLRSRVARNRSKRSGVAESNAQQYNEIVNLVNYHRHDNQRGVQSIVESKQDESDDFDMNATPSSTLGDEVSVKPIKLPKYFRSHIQRPQTNYEAQQMHRVLTMLRVDLQQINDKRQDFNNKSVLEKRVENERARQRSNERFHRFNGRNCESVSHQIDNFNYEDSMLVSEQKFNTIDRMRENSFEHRSKMFNSKFQVEQPKFVPSTGFVNGRQLCNKHLQQMMPINYLRLLENYQKRRNSQVHVSGQTMENTINDDSILVSDDQSKLKDNKPNEDLSLDNAGLTVPSIRRQTTQNQTNYSTTMIADQSNQPTFRQMDDHEKDESFITKDEFRTQESTRLQEREKLAAIDKKSLSVIQTKAAAQFQDEGPGTFYNSKRSNQDEIPANIFKSETPKIVEKQDQKVKIEDTENFKNLQALNQKMANEISLDIEKILQKEQLFKEMVQQRNEINMFSQTDSIDTTQKPVLLTFSEDVQLESGHHDIESSPAISAKNLVDKMQIDSNAISPTMSINNEQTHQATLANNASLQVTDNEQTQAHIFSKLTTHNNTCASIDQNDTRVSQKAEMESQPGPIRQEDSRVNNIKKGSVDILDDKNFDTSTNNPETRDYSSIRNNDVGVLSADQKTEDFFDNSRPQGYGTALPGMRKRKNPLQEHTEMWFKSQGSCEQVQEQARPVTQENINNSMRNRRMKQGSIGAIIQTDTQKEHLNQLYSIGSPNNKTSQLSQWGIKQNKRTPKNKKEMPPIKAYPGAQQKFNYMNKRMTTAPALNGSGMRGYGNARVKRNFMTKSKLNENKNQTNRANDLSLDHEIQVGSGMPNDQSKQSSILDSFEAQRQQFCQTANPIHYRSKVSNAREATSDIKNVGQRKTLPGIKQVGNMVNIVANQSQMTNTRERLQTLPVDYIPVQENGEGILSMQEQRTISLPRGAMQTKDLMSPTSKRSNKRPMKDYVELFQLTQDAVNSEMLSQRSQSRNQARPRSIMNQYNFSLSLKSPEMKTKNLNEANTLDVIEISRNGQNYIYSQSSKDKQKEVYQLQHFDSQENQKPANLMSPSSINRRTSRKATRVGTNEATERMITNSKEQTKEKHVGFLPQDSGRYPGNSSGESQQ